MSILCIFWKKYLFPFSTLLLLDYVLEFVQQIFTINKIFQMDMVKMVGGQPKNIKGMSSLPILMMKRESGRPKPELEWPPVK